MSAERWNLQRNSNVHGQNQDPDISTGTNLSPMLPFSPQSRDVLISKIILYQTQLTDDDMGRIELHGSCQEACKFEAAGPCI